MHGEREAACFRHIGAEMEGPVTVLACCISSTANGYLTDVARDLKDAQPKYGRAFLNVNKFQGIIQGHKKHVEDWKMDFLVCVLLLCEGDEVAPYVL